ncbi:MAG: acireductone dioxygenase [Armatimonadetes bacterium 55-13]|nr:cupin domain-containing protein [Armatimonadota bacterium]ODU52637.1 MAG: acireductone dioxygenase [bacterium SCN 57-13]OJU61813.1 MAG: acireductone dioxygenase [Armatimonadetes bacterium 55-13]
MATLRIPDRDQTISDYNEIKQYLAGIGIGYEIWKPSSHLERSATNEEVLNAFAGEINKLKDQGGYQTADVIDLFPDTPNLDVMLAKFSKEHWHDEDEVRFIIEGSGVFHIHPKDGEVVALEVEEGDLARVPAGTWHWFDLCENKRIRAIRLFQDPSGWTPHYTESGVDSGYMPVCFGLSFIPAQLQSL